MTSALGAGVLATPKIPIFLDVLILRGGSRNANPVVFCRWRRLLRQRPINNRSDSSMCNPTIQKGNMSMRRTIYLAAVSAMLLSACGASEDTELAKDEPLSALGINSAKRQCVSVAVLQEVPSDAAREMCDCTIDRLIDLGQYTSTTTPTDAQQQVALDACLQDTPKSG